MATTTKAAAVSEIPAGSALSAFQRKGIEGKCLACGQLVHTHYGHRGVWIGCTAKGLSQAVPFILVPLRRRQETVKAVRQAAKAHDAAAAKDTGLAARLATAKSHTEPRAPYLYRVRDRRRKIKGLTPARQQVLNVLTRVKHPLPVREVAEKAKHPKETTQQILVWLVHQGYARRDAAVAA